MTKLTISDIADEMLNAFDLDDALGGLAMEQLHNRVKAQEIDPAVAAKMLNEGFLAALRKSNEKELMAGARDRSSPVRHLNVFPKVESELSSAWPAPWFSGSNSQRVRDVTAL
jgi:hypothetical protein